MDHLEACGHCPKYLERVDDGTFKCTVYDDTEWVNRLGGCPSFPLRDLPETLGGMQRRVGQQKQKHSDRSYSSKNDGRRKFRRSAE
jgi:hypothetical protein